MKEMKSMAKDLGRVAPRDRGEKYWPVKMLTDEEAEKEFSEPALPGKSGVLPDEDKDDDN
jgi:hypothetical protein